MKSSLLGVGARTKEREVIITLLALGRKNVKSHYSVGARTKEREVIITLLELGRKNVKSSLLCCS